jgi:hypothetical protein
MRKAVPGKRQLAHGPANVVRVYAAPLVQGGEYCCKLNRATKFTELGTLE